MMVTALEHGVTLVDAHYMRERFAGAYLVVQDGRAAFVETGTAHAVPHLLAALAGAGRDVGEVDFVIVTHVHLDHAGGAGELLSALPNARLVVHRRGAPHLVEPKKLWAGALAVYGEAFMAAHYGRMLPVPANRVLEAEEGTVLALANRRLEIIDAPGHARHHLCVFDEASRGWFTGDAFGLGYPELATPHGPWVFPSSSPVQFDPAASHRTIDRMLSRLPARVFLTHFGELTALDQPAKDLHCLIDQLVAIADAHADASESPGLADAIMTLFLSHLRAAGSSLDQARARELLAIDVGLNAQGLRAWLDRRSAKK